MFSRLCLHIPWHSSYFMLPLWSMFFLLQIQITKNSACAFRLEARMNLLLEGDLFGAPIALGFFRVFQRRFLWVGERSSIEITVEFRKDLSWKGSKRQRDQRVTTLGQQWCKREKILLRNREEMRKTHLECNLPAVSWKREKWQSDVGCSKGEIPRAWHK